MVQKDFFAKVTIYRILSDFTWCHPFQNVKYYQHYLWTSSPIPILLILILILIMIIPSRWNTLRKRTWAATRSASSRRAPSGTSRTWKRLICQITSGCFLPFDVSSGPERKGKETCLFYVFWNWLDWYDHASAVQTGVDLNGHICGTLSPWKVFEFIFFFEFTNLCRWF